MISLDALFGHGKPTMRIPEFGQRSASVYLELRHNSKMRAMVAGPCPA